VHFLSLANITRKKFPWEILFSNSVPREELHYYKKLKLTVTSRQKKHFYALQRTGQIKAGFLSNCQLFRNVPLFHFNWNNIQAAY
jgi:hypothetical protein